MLSIPARYTLAALLVLGISAVAIWRSSALDAARLLTLDGQTMGTTYTVKLVSPSPVPAAELHAMIEARLKAINQALSTWDSTSEISRVNSAGPRHAVKLSEDFARVLSASLSLSRDTDGAFDATVGPLVNLWGFGPVKRVHSPAASEISVTRRAVGYHKLAFEGEWLTKNAESMALDFSGIAPGYAVDELGDLLSGQGITRYLIELGGEVLARGKAPDGGPWLVGVEQPDENLPPGQIMMARIRLEDAAVSTSGSYRRFRLEGQRRVHHILDPRTGYPPDSPLVAVVVHAPSCTLADGIGTALMVMGTEAGLRWVAQRPGIEAIFIERREAGGFISRSSAGIQGLLEPAP